MEHPGATSWEGDLWAKAWSQLCDCSRWRKQNMPSPLAELRTILKSHCLSLLKDIRKNSDGLGGRGSRPCGLWQGSCGLRANLMPGIVLPVWVHVISRALGFGCYLWPQLWYKLDQRHGEVSSMVLSLGPVTDWGMTKPTPRVQNMFQNMSRELQPQQPPHWGPWSWAWEGFSSSTLPLKGVGPQQSELHEGGANCQQWFHWACGPARQWGRDCLPDPPGMGLSGIPRHWTPRPGASATAFSHRAKMDRRSPWHGEEAIPPQGLSLGKRVLILPQQQRSSGKLRGLWSWVVWEQQVSPDIPMSRPCWQWLLSHLCFVALLSWDAWEVIWRHPPFQQNISGECGGHPLRNAL